MELSREDTLLLLGCVPAGLQEAPAEVPKRMIIMICCLGFFAGLFIGQYLGGPWIVIAPAIGFIAGLVGDVKLLRKMHLTGRGKACHD